MEKQPRNVPTTGTTMTLTVADLAEMFGRLTGEPIGGDNILDILDAGLLDHFVDPDALCAGQLRFDMSVLTWVIGCSELAALTAAGTITQAESEAALRAITPGMEPAFWQAVEWCGRYRRKMPDETRVFVTVTNGGAKPKRIELHYLAKTIRALRAARRA
jgi:hypothetical protein